jgi:hypothetical protein
MTVPPDHFDKYRPYGGAHHLALQYAAGFETGGALMSGVTFQGEVVKLQP